VLLCEYGWMVVCGVGGAVHQHWVFFSHHGPLWTPNSGTIDPWCLQYWFPRYLP